MSERNPLPDCLSHLAQGRGWQPDETAAWNAAIEAVHRLVSKACAGEGSIWTEAAREFEDEGLARCDISGGDILDRLPNAIWKLRK